MKTNGVNENNMRVSYLGDRSMIYLDLVSFVPLLQQGSKWHFCYFEKIEFKSLKLYEKSENTVTRFIFCVNINHDNIYAYTKFCSSRLTILSKNGHFGTLYLFAWISSVQKNRQKGSICHMVLCCSHNFLSKNKQLCTKRNHIILWIILCMFTLLGIPSKNVHWLYQSKSHALIWNTGLLVIWLSKLFDDEHCWRGIIFRNAHPLH